MTIDRFEISIMLDISYNVMRTVLPHIHDFPKQTEGGGRRRVKYNRDEVIEWINTHDCKDIVKKTQYRVGKEAMERYRSEDKKRREKPYPYQENPFNQIAKAFISGQFDHPEKKQEYSEKKLNALLNRTAPRQRFTINESQRI